LKFVHLWLNESLVKCSELASEAKRSVPIHPVVVNVVDTFWMASAVPCFVVLHS
jgi:hypothetical protein